MSRNSHPSDLYLLVQIMGEPHLHGSCVRSKCIAHERVGAKPPCVHARCIEGIILEVLSYLFAGVTFDSGVRGNGHHLRRNATQVHRNAMVSERPEVGSYVVTNLYPTQFMDPLGWLSVLPQSQCGFRGAHGLKGLVRHQCLKSAEKSSLCNAMRMTLSTPCVPDITKCNASTV